MIPPFPSAQGTDIMMRLFFFRAFRASAITALVGLAMAGAASAQALSRDQMQAVRAACEADIRATCPGVQPGGGRILQCIKANPDKISKPCKDALVAAKAETAQ